MGKKVDLDVLRKKIEAGEGSKQISEFFGVTVSAVSHAKKRLNQDVFEAEMFEQIIERHKKAADDAARDSNEAMKLKVDISKALDRLDQEITRATIAIQTHSDNIIGSWVDDLMHENINLKNKIVGWENEADFYKRFLKRTQAIREEFDKMARECTQQISDAEAVRERLQTLYEYQDRKNELREAFSEQKLFDFSDLVHEIGAFESEIFAADFLPFFVELQAKYGSEGRILIIPAPSAEEALEVEKFWKQWRYEFLKFSLLSCPWNGENAEKGESLLNQMRVLATNLRSDGLLRDFNDVFMPALQNQNARHHILKLR